MTIEEFVDEGINKAVSNGYNPTVFLGMRARYGTVEAINRLLHSSEPQSGYRRMVQLGLKDWTLENAVMKFPDLFPDRLVRANAQARLEGKLDA